MHSVGSYSPTSPESLIINLLLATPTPSTSNSNSTLSSTGTGIMSNQDNSSGSGSSSGSDIAHTSLSGSTRHLYESFSAATPTAITSSSSSSALIPPTISTTFSNSSDSSLSLFQSSSPLSPNPNPLQVQTDNDKYKVNKNNMSKGELFSMIEEMLLTGKREEASTLAMEHREWALALLISSNCGPEKYREVSKAYATCTFPSSSPLHLATLLFSNQVSEVSSVSLPLCQTQNSLVNMCLSLSLLGFIRLAIW